MKPPIVARHDKTVNVLGGASAAGFVGCLFLGIGDPADLDSSFYLWPSFGAWAFLIVVFHWRWERSLLKELWEKRFRICPKCRGDLTGVSGHVGVCGTCGSTVHECAWYTFIVLGCNSLGPKRVRSILKGQFVVPFVYAVCLALSGSFWLDWGSWVMLVPAMFFLVMLSLAFWKTRREGRLREEIAQKNNLACLKCLYDLTGNESGTCPECGWEYESQESIQGAWSNWKPKGSWPFPAKVPPEP